jgi:GntR family transcriptional regulator / MocR family aminotransferase
MRPWTFPVAVDAASEMPLFLQIARAIAGDVLRGRLRPGDALPGSRALAEELGVHRSTVVAAYGELTAQGWTVTRSGSATAIAASSPDVAPRRFSARVAQRPGVPAKIGFDLAPPPPGMVWPTGDAHPAPGTLVLWGGVPDVRLVSLELLGRALRRATRLQGRPLLGYAHDRNGHPRLREALARMLSAARGLAAAAEDVFITQGSQMALDLTARALVTPGDVVAVEAIGYRAAWAAFQRAGADLRPIPVDAEGMDVDALGEVARGGRLRAVHTTPQHQYPTTAVLSPRRRLALLELARTHRFAIVEDDYDHEFHYEGRPVLPLASADTSGHVVYVGSLAKILAPGLRIGFVVAPPPFLARLASERTLTDNHGIRLVEAAVAELLEDGEVQRHARRARRIYRERRDTLVAALQRHLGGALSLRVPPGGMALWAEAARGIDVERWRERALAAGVVFQTASDFTFDGGRLPFLRLGFAMCNERELETAARRLARSCPR